MYRPCTACSEENFLVLDLNVDATTGLVSTALGEPLDGKEIKARLKKLSDLQKVKRSPAGGVNTSNVMNINRSQPPRP